jgi:cysteine synthase
MDENNHSKAGHETTDVNVWAIGKFAIGLVIVCAVSVGLLFGLFKYFQSREETSLAVTVDPTRIFPQPQLQKTPISDLKAVRAEEDKMLNGYAWVDQSKGIVRIPVDRAIEVLAQRGLPTRSEVQK